MSASRKFGFGFFILLAILVAFVGIVLLESNGKLSRTYDIQGANLSAPTDSASVARGAYLAEALLACGDCHGADLGGAMFMDAVPMGKIPAPNLTQGRGGLGPDYSARDWDRAIRHGISRDGTGFLFMPAKAYTHLTDGEMEDLIAYMNSIPPVDREFPARSVGPVTRMLLTFGQPIQSASFLDHDLVRPKVAPEGATVERGAHLVEVSGCRACHGKTLSGGKVPGADPSWPPAGNLTPHAEGLGRYSVGTFERALRTGQKPDGGVIDPAVMPWPSYARMEAGEIQAIWDYLATVEPVPTQK